MKLRLKEDPKAWRKAVLLPALPLAVIASILHWRGRLSDRAWWLLLAAIGAAALCSLARPRWFRAYYRWSTRFGFWASLLIGRAMLLLFFLAVIAPLGLVLRWTGNDPLQLKRRPAARTYWHEARRCSPLDRLF